MKSPLNFINFRFNYFFVHFNVKVSQMLFKRIFVGENVVAQVAGESGNLRVELLLVLHKLWLESETSGAAIDGARKLERVMPRHVVQQLIFLVEHFMANFALEARLLVISFVVF